MLYFIIIIVQAVIFGFATRTVIENKGYDEDWFFWGFLFGFIALIVACARPQNIDYTSFDSQPSQSSQPYQPTYTNYLTSYGSNQNDTEDVVHNEQLLANGGWKCSCGRVHALYVSSCSCGKSKSEIQEYEYKKKLEEQRRQEELKKQEETKAQVGNMDEISKASAIKEYKSLLDAGIISQEEFEAKKKQLLGL